MDQEKLNYQGARIESFKEGYFAALKWVSEEIEREGKQKVNADNQNATTQ